MPANCGGKAGPNISSWREGGTTDDYLVAYLKEYIMDIKLTAPFFHKGQNPFLLPHYLIFHKSSKTIRYKSSIFD